MKLNPVYIIIIIVIFQLFIGKGEIVAQNSSDIQQFENLFKIKAKKSNYKSYLKGNSNELQQISSLLFVFYKEFLSSQDGNRCVFHPSCSVYAIKAVKKQGLIVGIMNGIDRLSRCNRLSPENYSTYKNTNLFYDPID